MTSPVEIARPRGSALMRSDAAQRLLAFAALIVMIVVFSVLSPNFLQFSNISGILLATAVNGVLALGVTFVIVSGGIDLSIGTVMTLSAVMTGVAATNMGWPLPIAVLVGFGTGALAGFANGILIAKLKIPPFIATLGMLNVAKGLALVISGLKPIYFNDTPDFNSVAMGSFTGSIIPGFEIPNIVFVFLFAALLASLVLTKTVLGRYTFALAATRRRPGSPASTWIAGRSRSTRYAASSPDWPVCSSPLGSTPLNHRSGSATSSTRSPPRSSVGRHSPVARAPSWAP